MIFTIPVLLYQLLFVLILYIASRFGNKVLAVTLVACLIWTATHIFLLPLMVLQGTVILVSYLCFRKRPRTSVDDVAGTKPQA